MSDAIENFRAIVAGATEDERLRAVEGLFESRDLRSLPILEGLAERDPSLHVRYMAQRSIHLLRKELGVTPAVSDAVASDDVADLPPSPSSPSPSPPPPPPSSSSPPSPRPGAVPTLEPEKFAAAFESAPLDRRKKLLKVAVHLKSRDVLPFLARRLAAEKDDELRSMTAVAVGILGGPSEVAALARLVGDAAPRVRLGALEGLEHIGHPSMYPVIVRFLADTDPEIRRRAVRALKRLGRDGLVNLFDHMLESSTRWMQDSAAYAMSVITSAAFLPLLEKGMRHPEREVRAKIRTGLELLAEKGEESARRLLEKFSDQTMAFHDEAAALFGSIEIGAADGPDPLFDDIAATRIREVDRIIDEHDEDRVASLCIRLEAEDDPEVRTRIVVALGRVGNLGCLRYLTRRLNDENPRVRSASVEAILTLSPDDLPEELELLLYDEDPMVRAGAIVALRDAYPAMAMRALDEMSASDDPDCREPAFYAVSAIADHRIVPLVVRFLADPDPELRDRAMGLVQQFVEEGAAVAAPLLEAMPAELRSRLHAPQTTRETVEEFARELQEVAPPRGGA